MKFRKCILDEMQEKNNAKVEHIGICGTTAALFLSVMIQLTMNVALKCLLGEFIILEVLCIYMVVGKLKFGICGRFCKPSIKNYLIGSTITALIEWGIIYLTAFIQGWTDGIFRDALFFSGLTFILCFVMTAIIGYIYKKRRQNMDCGDTYQELAQAVGVTVHTLKAIENGSYNPSIKLCRAICNATGTSLNELFGENEIHLPQIAKSEN